MVYHELSKEFIRLSYKFRRQKFQRIYDETMSGEIFLIFYILYQKEAITPGMISNKMGISSARVAAMLNSLEQKGLIYREKLEKDKRKIQVVLTSDGIELAQKTQINILNQVESKLSLLDLKDAQELIRIISTLADKLNL